MTERTHGDFIMLQNCETKPPTSTMSWYHTQSHYPHTEPTRPCLIMPSARLGSDKYDLYSYWFDSARVRTDRVRIPDLPKWEADAPLIWPFRLLFHMHNWWSVDFNRLQCYFIKKLPYCSLIYGQTGWLNKFRVLSFSNLGRSWLSGISGHGCWWLRL